MLHVQHFVHFLPNIRAIKPVFPWYNTLMTVNKNIRRTPTRHYVAPHRHVSDRPQIDVQAQVQKQHFWGSVVLILALATTLIFALYLTIQVLVVRQVICVLGDTGLPCSRSLADTAQKLVGKPLLFYNFAHKLEAARADRLDFDYVTYEKFLPGTLVVRYYFPAPAYQVAIQDGDWLSFSDTGRYTILPGAGDTLQIHSQYHSLNTRLAQFQTDPVVHQKIIELLTRTQGQRENWQRIDLQALNGLRIETNRAAYLLDLFNLDQDLQEMVYLESYRQHEPKQEIDLRLDLPAVRDLEPATQ